MDAKDPVLSWLLEPSDPAVRARTLTDLLGQPRGSREVQQALGEAGVRGSASRVLTGIRLEARDARSLYRPKYGAPFHRLVALAEMGIPASEHRVAELLDACMDAFFDNPEETEVCLTGNLARAALRMGRGDDPRVERALRWLVETQLPDGGWHCWPDKAPHGTVDAWEALGAFDALPRSAWSPSIRASAERGVEFFLSQGLGLADPYEPWRRLHFPRHYYYDVFVGLDLATALGNPRDPRLAPALAWLEAKRRPDGRWSADAAHPDLAEGADYTLRTGEPVTPLVVEEPLQPSKWVTLAALCVLRRSGAPQ